MTLRLAFALALTALAGCPDRDPIGVEPDAAMGLPDAAAPPDAPWLPACRDGVDNDNDGITDFPDEPGCDSYADDDETDPKRPPACANGVDDDGDGWIDYPLDPGCGNASDVDESDSVIPPECGPTVVVEDITAIGMGRGAFAGEAGELQSPTCGGMGAERVFTYTVLSGPVNLIISTDYPETTVDTIVYVRTACRREDSEIGCDDDGAGVTGGPSVLNLAGVDTGTYFIIVDSFGPGSLGDFVVSVTEETP